MPVKNFTVKLEQNLCKACGLCYELCTTGSLAALPDGKAYVADEDKCNGCRSCELHCPDFCLDIVDKEAE